MPFKCDGCGGTKIIESCVTCPFRPKDDNDTESQKACMYCINSARCAECGWIRGINKMHRMIQEAHE
jgi:hypothetical protein